MNQQRDPRFLQLDARLAADPELRALRNARSRRRKREQARPPRREYSLLEIAAMVEEGWRRNS